MGPIWDPSGQPAYGLTHMGPLRNPVALPIWVLMGSQYGTHIGMFDGLLHCASEINRLVPFSPQIQNLFSYVPCSQILSLFPSKFGFFPLFP